MKNAYQYVMDRLDPNGTQAERRRLEQLWFGNLSYYTGAPYFINDPITGAIRAPKSKSVRRRTLHQANLIRPKVLRAIAKLEQVNPTFKVAPASPSREDRHAAKLSELVFRHLWQVTKFQQKRRRALLWAATCGSGFLKISWDPTAGTANRIWLKEDENLPDVDAAINPVIRQAREAKGRYRDTFPGEVDVEVVEPFQMWWDPKARGGGFDECDWVATRTATPTSEIKERWGVAVQADDEDLTGVEAYREAFAWMAGGLWSLVETRRPRPSEVAIVTDYYERPLKSNGMKGRHLVIAGGQVLEGGPNPYATTGTPLPFVKIDWFPEEGRFMGGSLVEDLRHPQRAYNEARSHTIDYQKTHGYAPTYLPKGGGVKPVQVVAMHGPIYEFNATVGAPVFGQPPNLPPYIAENAAIASGEMDKIAAQTDPSNNRLPGQLRSGAAIQGMQADNNAILTPISESLMEAIAEAGTQMLQLVGLFYDSPRVMQVTGKGGEYDVEYFIGADLRGQYQLQIVSQPGALESIEAREAKMMDAVQLGILNPMNPEHIVLLFKGLNFHTSDEFINALVQQDSAEEREIKRMVDVPNYLPQAMPWMDPEVRSKTCERFMNSLEFEMLDPLTQQKIAARWQQWVTILQERMQQQIALTQLVSGGSPQAAPKGEPSQPRMARAR